MRMDWASYIDIGVVPESIYWFEKDQEAWDSAQLVKERTLQKVEDKPNPFTKQKKEIKSPFKL